MDIIQHIHTFDLTPGDIIVLTVDVGKMPPQRAKAYMDQHKEMIQDIIGTDYKIIVKTPKTQIEIIRTPSNGVSAMKVEEEPVDTDGQRMDDFERAKPIE